MARLTLKEAADRLGMSTRTLRRRIKEGSLFAALEEGKYYIDVTEVDRLLSSQDKVDTAKYTPKAKAQATITETITLDRREYDSLIAKLASLETQVRLLEAPPKKSSFWKRLFSKE